MKEEELASGVMRARAVMATMAAPLARHRSHRRQRRAQREERVSKQRQPWARAGGGKSRGERSWMKLVSAVPKRADAQREMRRQNGQRETKLLFSSGRDEFSLSESFCKTAATALIRIAESCLGRIWAGYLVDCHHDVSDSV